MGIISKSCNVEGHKKELIFFYLSKYHKFNEIKFKQNYNG